MRSLLPESQAFLHAGREKQAEVDNDKPSIEDPHLPPRDRSDTEEPSTVVCLYCDVYVRSQLLISWNSRPLPQLSARKQTALEVRFYGRDDHGELWDYRICRSSQRSSRDLDCHANHPIRCRGAFSLVEWAGISVIALRSCACPSACEPSQMTFT